MEIRWTEAAQVQLAEKWPDDKDLRIIGRYVGGCGANVEYSLVWDREAANDHCYPLFGQQLRIDPLTVEYLSVPVLTIDYRPNQGFRLVTPEQILSYGLQVREA
ncbi:iron-sulfur cluster biosynthesis family protein [Brevibacillus fulvus]|uniref:FeS cluster biogenesis domain-containing protein n=1 Tax=Brevibacillus fulvus TaxID=1125967 RepID=A0A939BS96_9BACL|nr:iron-sulfur cluster biosynthesis family protein [Brevibacillus fulvus]MBM7590477.1 hypothetical protein [Brevibacillus fulvus]